MFIHKVVNNNILQRSICLTILIYKNLKNLIQLLDGILKIIHYVFFNEFFFNIH